MPHKSWPRSARRTPPSPAAMCPWSRQQDIDLMTIQISNTNNAALSGASLPPAGGDDITTQHKGHAASATGAPDPASWHDTPPREVGQPTPQTTGANSLVALSLPPEDQTGGQASKDLTDK